MLSILPGIAIAQFNYLIADQTLANFLLMHVLPRNYSEDDEMDADFAHLT